jgi:hypothetical protein
MISDTAIMKEIMHHRNPSLENPLAYGIVPEGKMLSEWFIDLEIDRNY